MIDNITMRETINTIKNSYLTERSIVFVVPSTLRVGYLPMYYSFPYNGTTKDFRVTVGNSGDLTCKIYMLTEDEFSNDDEGIIIKEIGMSGAKVLVGELVVDVVSNSYFKILIEQGTNAKDVSFQINIKTKEVV